MIMVLMAGTLCLSVVPQTISFQGMLKDSAGSLVTGTREITFRICSALQGGTVLWNEMQTVSVEAGLYSVQLASVTSFPADLFNGDARYLGIVIGGTELAPRVMILTVPYAFKAASSDTAAHATYADSAGSSGTAGAVLLGPTTIQSTSAANAIWVKSTSGTAASFESVSGDCIIGYSVNNYGISGNSDSGVGVFGHSETSHGVAGYSANEYAGYFYGGTGVKTLGTVEATAGFKSPLFNPSSGSDSAGPVGIMRWGSAFGIHYIYVKVGANTWKRATLEAF